MDGHASGGASEPAAPSMSPAPELSVKPRPKRNKFAFACASLASMTSILLGYGEHGNSI